MFMHLLLTEIAEECHPSQELLKYSAERTLAAMENHEDAVQLAFASDQVFNNTVASMLHARGYESVKFEKGDEAPHLVHNGHARIVKLSDDLVHTAEVAASALVTLDYQAQALKHVYTRSGIAETESEVNVQELIGTAFMKTLERLKELDGQVSINIHSGQAK